MPHEQQADASPDVRAPHGPLPEGGTVRAITRWGTPVMHRPQAAVTTYDEALTRLAADMVATMYAADGVGLAACQVGEDVAMFVFDCPDDDGVHGVGVVCNPVLTLPEGKDRQLESDDEGCLSYPGSFEPHPYFPGRLYLESRIDKSVGDELASRGHQVYWWDESTWLAGAVCTILADPKNGVLHGGADTRRPAYVLGW